MSEVLSKLFRKSGLLAIAPVLIFSAFFALLVTTTQPHNAKAFCTNEDGTRASNCTSLTNNTNNEDCYINGSYIHAGPCTSGDTTGGTKPSGQQPNTTGCKGQVDFPNTAIVYCGLTKSDANDAAKELMAKYYDLNTDGRPDLEHKDVKKFYTDQGLNDTIFSDGNWKSGYTNISTKQVTLSDKTTVVGNAYEVFARCFSDGDPHCDKSQNGTIMSTPDFYGGSIGNWMPTIIHFDANGDPDFVLWKPCANLVHFHKIPKKVLSCKALSPDFKQENDTFHYTFTVTANVKNVDTFTYHIDYGDSKTDHYDTTKGETQTVFKHDYKQLDKDQYYVIKATINDQPQVETCQTKIKIPGKPPVNSLACIDLKAVPTDKEKKNYTFTGRVQVNNTTVTSYTFDFGDGVKQTFNTSDLTFSTTHTYADNASKDLVASFTATGPTGTTPLIDLCTAKFSRELIVTGPAGTMSIFALASVGGVALHQFVLRRKLTA